MRSDRDERGEKKIKISWSGSRTHCRSVLNQLRGFHSRCHAMVQDNLVGRPTLLRLLADGDGSSGRGQLAVSPPFSCSSPYMADGSRLRPLVNGVNSSTPSRTAATPPQPRSTQRAFRPTCSSFAPAPPPRAAPGDLRFSVLPDILSTANPLSSEGSLTACPSFLPGFVTNVTVRRSGRRRREPANI